MSLGRLWPLVFSLALVGIILLYMLKQKRKSEDVPSLILWKEVYRNIKAKSPWEKLRKNILMILQLIIVALLIFSLLEPITLLGGKEFRNLIIVFDITGSMKAKVQEKSKFELAQEEMEKLISSTKEGANVTILTSGKYSKVELSNEKNKSVILDKIKTLSPEDTTGKIEDSLSLVKSLCNAQEGSEVVFLTDKDFPIEGINGNVINLSSKGNNASVDLVSYKETDKGISVISKITNRGAYEYEGDFSLYGDDKLLAVKEINLSKDESKVLTFELESKNISILKGELSEKDAISEDNTYYSFVKREENQKVLLLSEKNLFMEKALKTVKGIEVSKVDSLQNYNPKDEYDIYIFDGVIPDKLPEKGNIIFINAPSNEFFKVANEVEGGNGNAKIDTPLTDKIKNLKFGVKSINQIQKEGYLKGFLSIKDREEAFYGEKDGRKIIAIPFKLSDSDIVLKPEFPIMVHNFINYLSLGGILSSGEFSAGESVPLNPNIDGGDINITNPKGKEKSMPIRFPMKEFEETNEVGIYKVTQDIKGEKKEEKFGVNFPSSEESDVTEEGSERGDNKEFKVRGGRNLTEYMVILSLIVLMIEWFIYTKKN
ncbi:BatA and WFA domain-containing protein [Clostridium sp. YIM B02551]|uniref:vWA domain-containing protein n=1 Tax=Clostridium sp. YIM B02551 TaxID=2910679 RepID=UPI001EEB15F7|nr:BatA and WFA domain-containing protein [Clostridium sp. YIM B02551]